MAGTAYGIGDHMYNKISGRQTGIGFGNNAIEFYNHPIQSSQGASITLGNTICYDTFSPTTDTQDHERQHTYQNEKLGPTYFPAHIMMGLGSAFNQRFGDGNWKNWNEGWHKYNPLEQH
jgi:hypothetical protein